MAKLVGIEQDYPGHEHKTQVFRATHSSAEAYNKKGQYIGLDWSRKSFMERSFISFSYGGRYIEDFNLIAVFSNDGLNKTMTATFKDLTSDYDVVDGQFFWGTKYEANKLDFSLATDGITENELDEFLHWFHGGVERELILSEHPNRAILARVADAPEIQMIPFEEPTIVKIEGFEYETSTTLYKGTISLSFTMDEPYWYSKVNLLGRAANSTELTEAGLEDGVWMDVWQSANAQEVDVYSDKDALKIIKEDLVPTAGMLSNDFLLGDAITVNTDFTIESNKKNTNDDILDTDVQTLDNPIRYNGIAVAGIVEETDSGYGDLIGFVGPRIYSQENKGAQLGSSDTLYLYYPGTAPEYPTISFNFTPQLTANYITSPRNLITNGNRYYDVLKFTSQTDHDLKFSLPSALHGYNQAIKIFNNWPSAQNNLTELKQLIRDGVNHRDARAWAILVIDALGDTWNYDTAAEMMRYFLTNSQTEEHEILATSVDIDCKTGRTTGIVGHRIIDVNDSIIASNTNIPLRFDHSNGNSYGSITFHNASDMSGLYYLTTTGYNLDANKIQDLTPEDKVTISFDYEYENIKNPHPKIEIPNLWIDQSTIANVVDASSQYATIQSNTSDEYSATMVSTYNNLEGCIAYRNNSSSPWYFNRLNRNVRIVFYTKGGYFGGGSATAGIDIPYDETNVLLQGQGHFSFVTNFSETQLNSSSTWLIARVLYTGNCGENASARWGQRIGLAKLTISNLKIELGAQETMYVYPRGSLPEPPTTVEEFQVYGTINNQKEDIGNMIKSNYICFDERNYPTSDGYIKKWVSSAPQNSYKVTSDNAGGLSNLYIKYQYKYY